MNLDPSYPLLTLFYGCYVVPVALYKMRRWLIPTRRVAMPRAPRPALAHTYRATTGAGREVPDRISPVLRYTWFGICHLPALWLPLLIFFLPPIALLMFTAYANNKARLTAEGNEWMATTGGDGLVEWQIPKRIEKCSVTVWPEHYPDGKKETWVIDLAEIPPVTDLKGAQTRLRNLGYYQGAINGELDRATADALREFQEDVRVAVTGQFDAETIAAIKVAHG